MNGLALLKYKLTLKVITLLECLTVILESFDLSSIGKAFLAPPSKLHCT